MASTDIHLSSPNYNASEMHFRFYSGSQNNLHCSCNGTTSNGAAAAVCTGGVLARKVPNHSGASPSQGNKRPVVSLTHLPKRPPVDVEFKNLAYSVSEGRKRGEFSRGERSVNRIFRQLFREKVHSRFCAIIAHSSSYRVAEACREKRHRRDFHGFVKSIYQN